MSVRWLRHVTLAGLCLAWAPAASTQAPAPPAAVVPAATPAGDLVRTYCVACHNQKARTANLALDLADAAQVGKSAEIWEKVVVQLRSRSMPPARSRRPDAATYDSVAAWLEAELDRAAAMDRNPGRPPSLHRLNRTEYANAIRDLVGIEIDAAALLPPDGQAHGFDTIADALTITPALQARYLTAAAKIARLAVGDPTIPPGFERYTAEKHNTNERTQLWHRERFGEEFPLGTRGGVVARHYFPVDGEYAFRVRIQRTIDGPIHGLQVPTEIDVLVDGQRVGRFTVGGPGLQSDQDEFDTRVHVKAGMRQVIATAVRTDATRPEGLGPAQIPIWSEAYGEDLDAQLIVSLLLVGGPYNGTVPADSPSRRSIFVCQPEQAAEEERCAATILSRLATRAYRRAATPDDTATLVEFYRKGRAAGFDNGIRMALERILASPDFLFRIEADPERAAAGGSYRLTDIELASRLSFFLWSSIPDQELLDAAMQGRLSDPAVLERQTRRMLADPRARQALVANFFGQWLQVRNVWHLTPDLNRRFPWFDGNLRDAFVREIELFVESQLADDRGVTELLTADYTFLNERLARHYGVPKVYGSHFRRVRLADPNRFGLLGKAGVLAVTSYPHRTSPTIRGKWLLETILAAPVPPPPPDVNTTLEEGPADNPTSVREMLDRHRANPVCASCHARMDPVGFTLENFDALGRWRTDDAGVPIDASGVLLDGTTVRGPAELRTALVRQEEQFVKAVAAKLLTYGIGRELHYYDAPAVRAIVRGAARDGFRWSSVILEVVRSTPFQFRRAQS